MSDNTYTFTVVRPRVTVTVGSAPGGDPASVLTQDQIDGLTGNLPTIDNFALTEAQLGVTVETAGTAAAAVAAHVAAADPHPTYLTAAEGAAAYDPLGAAAASTATAASALATHAALSTTAHGGIVPSTRSVGTTSPLAGGGALSGDLTLSVAAASTSAAGVVQLATPSADTTAGRAVQASDARLSDARTPTAHATSHKHGGSDEISTATPTANAIPKATAGGKLTSWIDSATNVVAGIALLGASGGAQTWAAFLDALTALATSGLIARTGAGTVAARTLTGTAPITVTNGDGVSGNPTIALTSATGSAAGSVVSGKLCVATEYYYAQAIVGQAPSTVTTTAGRIYFGKWTRRTSNTYSTIAVEITTAAAAGKFIRLCLYKQNSVGRPGSVIWYSADILSDATGVKSAALSGGTWVDTSYRDGSNNFAPAAGEEFYLAIMTEGAPTMRAMTNVNVEAVYGSSAPFGTGAANTVGFATAAYASGAPTTPTLTLSSSSVILYGLLPAT